MKCFAFLLIGQPQSRGWGEFRVLTGPQLLKAHGEHSRATSVPLSGKIKSRNNKCCPGTLIKARLSLMRMMKSISRLILAEPLSVSLTLIIRDKTPEMIQKRLPTQSTEIPPARYFLL